MMSRQYVVCCNNKSPSTIQRHVAMGYFYSTSVSIGWYFSLENGPFTYGKLCGLCGEGRFTHASRHEFWGFSFDPKRTTISHEDTIYCVKSFECVVDSSRGLIMALRDQIRSSSPDHQETFDQTGYCIVHSTSSLIVAQLTYELAYKLA